MKKLLNDVQAIVPEMLAATAMLHPGISLLEGYTIALRTDVAQLKTRGEVALISGGGAGHEPAHAGYVGPGMLTAAVVGDVFTSPSTDAVLAAIEAVAGPAGVLLIVKNYTGDRLNFGLAAEIARSQGHQVEMVVVDDDAALSARGAHAGRRGIAGTVLVHKVAGAKASSGANLQAVKEAALRAIAAVSSMGVALSACTVPAAGQPGFSLGPLEIELGLGIHGEPGVRRGTIAPADALVSTLLATLTTDLALRPGDRLAVLVNNLGGTPVLELGIVAGAVLKQLDKLGFVVSRCWSGTFLTALEMAGVSVSLMKLDDALLSALDAEAFVPAWPAAPSGRVQVQPGVVAAPQPLAAPVRSAPHTEETLGRQDLLLAIAGALEEAEAELTQLDQVVGDGDLGISLARGAKALRAGLDAYPLQDWPATLQAMSATLRRALGGTSGPLYAIGLLCAAESLKHQPGDWGLALQAASDGIATTGGARAGDRTMLDALLPAARALRDHAGPSACAAAVAQAHAGAIATASLVARQGRSSYLGERAVGHIDPGARAVVIWLQAIADS